MCTSKNFERPGIKFLAQQTIISERDTEAADEHWTHENVHLSSEVSNADRCLLPERPAHLDQLLVKSGLCLYVHRILRRGEYRTAIDCLLSKNYTKHL